MTTTVTRKLSVTDIKSSVCSYAGSLAYMKKIIPIAAMNIVNNRVTYEDSFFTKHKLSNIPYKTFRHNLPKKHVLFNFYYWLKYAMKGLEEKHLQDIFIVFNDKTGTMLEEYSFNITYDPNDDGNLPIGPQVMEATADFLKQINGLSSEDKLRHEDVTMKVQVVLHKGAPTDFLSNCFETEEPFDNTQNKTYDAILGVLTTGHHELKVLATGEIYKMNESTPSEKEAEPIEVINNNSKDKSPIDKRRNTRSEVEAKENINVSEVETKENINVSKKQTNPEANKENEVQNVSKRGKRSLNKATKPAKRPKRQIKATSSFDDFELPKQVSRTRTSKKRGDIKENQEDFEVEASTTIIRSEEEQMVEVESEEVQVEPEKVQIESEMETSKTKRKVIDLDDSMYEISISSGGSEDIQISCICKISDKIQNIEIVQCTKCTTYQHLPCVGYKLIVPVLKGYTCLRCQETCGKTITDTRMHSMKEEAKRVYLALLRLVCFYCCKTKKSPDNIFNLIHVNRHRIARNMEKTAVIIFENNAYKANIPLMEKQVLNGLYFIKEEDNQKFGNSCAINIEDENDSTTLY